jgi:hypothetical protein
LRTEVAAEAEADAAVVTEIAQARRKRRNELSGFFERRSLPTPDEVRGALNFLPFRPFKVSLIGGDVIEVRRADSVAITASGDQLVVCDDTGPHVIQTFTVTAIAPLGKWQSS